jgi:hypothetical protein
MAPVGGGNTVGILLDRFGTTQMRRSELLSLPDRRPL